MLPRKLLQRLGRTQWQLRRGSVLFNKIPDLWSVGADIVRSARAVPEVDGEGHRANAILLGNVWELVLIQDQEGRPVAVLGSEGLEFGDNRLA